MKIERLKSQDMLKAQEAAEDIMDAANGETIALLTQEAVEHVDEEQEEREEAAKEASEKKKEEKKEEAKKLEKEAMQQEMIENIKEKIMWLSGTTQEWAWRICTVMLKRTPLKRRCISWRKW